MQRYSIAHVRKQFKKFYNYEVERKTGYKVNRHQYTKYDVYDCYHNRILHDVTLNALADYLVSQGEY